MPIVSEEHKRKKKLEILNSALICFAEKGYEVATVDDIVIKSKVSKGAIYNYFKSKEEIYIELITEMNNKIFSEVTNKIKKLNNITDKIEFIVHYFLEKEIDNSISFKNQSSVKYEFHLAASRNKEFNNVLEDIENNNKLKIINRILNEGMENGEIKKEINVEIQTKLFWTFIDGITLQKLLFPNFPYKEVIKEQIQAFLNKLIIHKEK